MRLISIIQILKKYRLKKRLKLNNTVSIHYDIGISHIENLKIEDYVHLGKGTKIHSLGGVTIGRGTIFGPNVKIYSSNHKYKDVEYVPYGFEYDKREVVIKENVWIGGEVIIVPGTIIGEGCIIGAGTVLSGIIPPLSIVVGNPCRVINTRSKEDYERLKKNDKVYLKHKMIKNKRRT